MQEIRHAGPRDRDRKGQGPVGKRLVAAGAELQQEPNDDYEHLDATAPEVAIRLQVIRRGLPTGGRQDLHHPEDEDYLRYLRGNWGGKEATDQRKLRVAIMVSGSQVADGPFGWTRTNIASSSLAGRRERSAAPGFLLASGGWLVEAHHISGRVTHSTVPCAPWLIGRLLHDLGA
jgi:hypothetical protein